jgi:heptosyltransferase-2
MLKNILIFGHSNIGDVCYDLVVVDPLRKQFPQARLVFLTTSRCRDIVNGYRGVEKIITFDRNDKNKGFANWLQFILNLRKEKFDLAVVLKRSLTYKLLGIPLVWRVESKDSLRQKHSVDVYLKLLCRHGIEIQAPSFSFNLGDSEQISCEDFLKKRGIAPKDTLVGILPLAAWSLKSWPIEKWNELAKILKNKYGIKVINLGKAPNSDLGRRILKEISDEIIPADKTTLAQAMALLKRCQLFIGPDSSLLHLASCMGVETVGLYGATSREHFYPYFHRRNIVWPEKRLSCMPCYPGAESSCCNGETKYDFGPCMAAIGVEDVLIVIKERLNLV